LCKLCEICSPFVIFAYKWHLIKTTIFIGHSFNLLENVVPSLCNFFLVSLPPKRTKWASSMYANLYFQLTFYFGRYPHLDMKLINIITVRFRISNPKNWPNLETNNFLNFSKYSLNLRTNQFFWQRNWEFFKKNISSVNSTIWINGGGEKHWNQYE
jgi:hypothetical protein